MVKTKTFRKNRRNKRKTYSKKRRTNKSSLFKIGGVKYKTDEREMSYDINQSNLAINFEKIFGLSIQELIYLIEKYKENFYIKIGKRPWLDKTFLTDFNYIEYYSFKNDTNNPEKLDQDYKYNQRMFINQNQDPSDDKTPYVITRRGEKFKVIDMYTLVVLNEKYLDRSKYRIVIELDKNRDFCALLNINEFLKWVNHTEEKKNEEQSTTVIPNDTNVNNNNNEISTEI